MAVTWFIALRIIDGAAGQTTCAPLMQSLVQQAESTGQYGSWDACCARIGNDCYLTQQYAPPGFEPCDGPHSARAGYNRTPQGTVCMIGADTMISGSPCSASQIRMCGQKIVRDGADAAFGGFANLGVVPAMILSMGVLGTQLCCSTSSCQVSLSCALQYNMSCVTDGINTICVPLDQRNAQTYAIDIVQDGHGCAASTTTTVTTNAPSLTNSPSSSASGTSTIPVTTSAASVKNNNAAIIGGVVGGVAIVAAVAVAFAFIKSRNHRQSPPLANRRDDDDDLSEQRGPVTFTPSNATSAAYNPDAHLTFDPSILYASRAVPMVPATAEVNVVSAQGGAPATSARPHGLEAMAERLASLEAQLTSISQRRDVPSGFQPSPPHGITLQLEGVGPPPAYDDKA